MKQRTALTLIGESLDAHAADRTSPDLIDRGAFIHWRTAEALERRGLIEIERLIGVGPDGGDEWDLTLTVKGARVNGG